MRTGKLLLVGVAVFAILLAACSSDDDDPTASATGSMGSAGSTAQTDTGSLTITDIVSDNPDFSTLLTAVGEAGLAETLSGDGPPVARAPTDWCERRRRPAGERRGSSASPRSRSL